MNRRGFLRALAAAPFAASAVAASSEPVLDAGGYIKPQYGYLMGEIGPEAIMPINAARKLKGRPFNLGVGRNYVYRTGYPDIDALRSVSGVHKKRMEDKRPTRIVTSNILGEETVAYAG